MHWKLPSAIVFAAMVLLAIPAAQSLLCAFAARAIYARTPQAATASTPSVFGEKLHIPGLPNAGKISDHLYRGAQPHRGGLAQLKAQGITVTTVVDLRSEDSADSDWEQKEAESLGIHFVSIPVGAWSPPSSDQIVQFLSLFREGSKETVFVHCRRGEDRTGVFVATYRIAMQKWPVGQAISEMYFFGFSGFWHPSMRTFVSDFPALLDSVPALKSLSIPNPSVSAIAQPN
jgi:protein tyrosine phosphatase (PTP) superfamily phosphohydrolase (DUF442 family)